MIKDTKVTEITKLPRSTLQDHKKLDDWQSNFYWLCQLFTEEQLEILMRSADKKRQEYIEEKGD
ncbi:MAG: hypothetical protein LBB59_04470 [Campylobacteraceae bacterium]|jgi:hypothetical protein|nr:hypothetical protein [Campylobacteraceae bacterium]